MKNINEVIDEIEKAEASWHVEPVAALPTQYLKEWADNLRGAYKAFVAEALEVVASLASIDNCMHCDLHDACAEGEDGMPTTCNAYARARIFLEKYKLEESADDSELPF